MCNKNDSKIKRSRSGRACDMRTPKLKKILVVGVEPTTLGLLDPRSNQLSYTSSLSVYRLLCSSTVHEFSDLPIIPYQLIYSVIFIS